MKAEEYLQLREKKLGFKAQTEIVYNHNLPYAEHIDEESNHALHVIKTNLAKVVLCKELRPGVSYWTNQLTRYIRLYGLKFSKEDHILFTKLFYEVLMIPDLEILLVEQVCNVLAKLLKKRHLLTRKDLHLDWVPLYKLSERFSYSKMEPMGLEWIPSSMDNKLRSTIRSCRSYFLPESTESMLDEWKPLLCPFDVVMSKAVKYLDLFLPTLVYTDDERDSSWKLWLDEFLSLWKSVQNGPSWEKHFINLFGRLAHNNIGHIDWTSCVSTLFSRVLRSLALPVGKLQHTTALAQHVPLESSCFWIVSMMGGPCTKLVLQHLRSLLEATESFFHPSNFGKWSTNLLNFIQNITTKFIQRIFRERFKKKQWEPKIPTSHLIHDEDIEEFVTVLKPVTLLTLYSKLGAMTATKVLQGLSYLRPDLIIPDILNKSYIALGTLTEPHQVRACLAALSCTVSPGISGFPEMRNHILPILFQCLPALDPNDLPKSTVAFQFISTCMTMIPLVDCSEAVQYHRDLSENDRELCLMTSQFEDFAIQFLDRCFVLLEGLNNDSHTHESFNHNDIKVTASEGTSGIILVTASAIVLEQASKPIYKACLEKLFRFSTTHLLEGHVAMSTAATLFAVAVKANPSVGFATFIPYYCRAVLDYFADNPDAEKHEKVDKQLLWDLKVLSEICHVGTEHLLKYKELLFEVAAHGFKMTAKEGYEAAVRIVKFCVRGWTIYYTYDRKSVSYDINQNSADYLAIKDWGASTTPWEMNMHWHVPSEEEFESAFEALNLFLHPAVAKVSDFNEGNGDLTKEELHKLLYIIKELTRECYLLLPIDTSCCVDLDEDRIVPLKSWPVETIKTLPFYHSSLSKENRKDIRERIFAVVNAALQKLLSCREDDVESVCSIIDIYSQLCLMHEQLKSEFDQHWKVFAGYKAAMRNPLQTNKRKDRFSHIDRTVLQQRMRILAIERSTYTPMHHKVMLDLIRLSTSHYMQVRGNAQALFFHGLSFVPSSAYKLYLPHILKHFDKSNGAAHQEFKGALYLLIGKSKSRSFLGYFQKWDVMGQVWPALINAPHSDKPSIKKLYEKLALKIQAHFMTIAMKYQVSESATQAALNLLGSQSLPEPQEFDMSALTSQGECNLEKRNQGNLEMYHQLVNDLIDLYESGELTWKYSELVLGMLSLMLRHDVSVPTRLSSLFVRLLVDDAISIRTLSLACIGSIMKQQKRKHAVEMLSLEEIVENAPKFACESVPGDREDNAWHQYDPSNLPDTEEKFNSTKFIDKTHWGYYCWPKKLKTYASQDKQPKLDRDAHELCEEELPVYTHFTDADFVEKVVKYLCLENEKGKDKFDDKKMDMFRGLFRNFGDTFVPYFKPHVLQLVGDKRESYQRCAAEIIKGIVMGSKHWPFDKVERMWGWVIPALRTAITNISPETLKDWDTALNHIVQNRDPRRIHWVLEFLTNEPKQVSNSALIEASKLFIMQGGMHQQEWRTPRLLQKMLEYIEPMLGHPFKNIRNRVGSVVASIFLYDVQLTGKRQPDMRSPSTEEFIQRLLPRLESLMSEETPPLSSASSESSVGNFTDLASSSPDIVEEFNIPIPIGGASNIPEMDVLSPSVIEQIQKGLKKLLPPGSPMPEITSLSGIQDQLPAKLLPTLGLEKATKSDEGRIPVEDSLAMQVDVDGGRSETIRIFKTIMKWIVSGQRSNLQPFRSCYLSLLPLVCKMYPVDQQGADEELHRDSRLCLSCIGQSLVRAEDIPKVVATVEGIVSNSSWHARHTILAYIQVFVFTNLFTIKLNDEAIAVLKKIILHLLEDEQYEVSQMASVTLSGLIQCGAIPLDDALLNLAYGLSSTKVKKKTKANMQDAINQKNLLKRHAGVLILSSCVLSSPYTVPMWMPKIVMRLSDHLHDPQPIQGTIKRTLSDFRRTHHDNWHEDKQKFSSDELAVLTDLLVSPSYYA